jgi:hypothetical protein
MRITFSVLTLICCGVWGASQASAASICAAVPANLVANCGFETGDLTSWTLSGSILNPLSTYYGVDSFDANSGNDGAYISQDFIDDGTAPVDLSQTLATTAGKSYYVTFFLEQDTTPTTGYKHALTVTWGGNSIMSLTPTVAVPGAVGAFTAYTLTETATSASTNLTFAFENDDSYWSFDDVSVSPTPEPSTYLLGGMALSILLLLKRGATGGFACRRVG